MRFQVRDQIWQVVETTRDGDIAVLVVDGRPTKRRGFFPHPQGTTAEHPPSLSHSQKSCVHCAHWKKQDRDAVLWEIEPPDEYDCEVWQIERQWTDPQAVFDAAYRGPELKAETIAKQCPSFNPVSIPN